MRTELPVKVHKIQPRWNECKLFRSLNTVLISLPLTNLLYIYIYTFYTFTCTHIPFLFAYIAPWRARKYSNRATSCNLNLFYLCARFGGRENVNTRRAIHFRSGRIYFDSTLMAVLVVEIRSFVSRIY